MKALFATLALVFSTSAFASPLSEPVELFLKDQAVQAEIKAAGMNDLKVEKPTSTLIGISCGFAGCDKTYLVTSFATTASVNEQGQAIAAIVRISFVGNSVKLVNLETL